VRPHLLNGVISHVELEQLEGLHDSPEEFDGVCERGQAGKIGVSGGRAQLAHRVDDEEGVLLVVEGVVVHGLLDEVHVEDGVDLLAELDVVGEEEAEELGFGLGEDEMGVLVVDWVLGEVFFERVPEGVVDGVVDLFLEAVWV